MGEKLLKVALAGNPNSGKSTLFNELTGLNQKVSNYPGATVDRKTGVFHLRKNGQVTVVKVTDLPGAYGFSAHSEDERIASEIISQPQHPDHPDAIIYVADTTNLKRSLFFCTQIMDRGMPVLLALNMTDEAKSRGISVNALQLAEEMGIRVLEIAARKGDGVANLKEAIVQPVKAAPAFMKNSSDAVLARYERIEAVLQKCIPKNENFAPSSKKPPDSILMHRLCGPLIFLGILALIFQFIFSLAQYPMDLIDAGFVQLNNWLSSRLPDHFLTSLLTDGVIAGLSGVLVFVPQIALLFFFIAIMDDTGYMARVSLMTDKLMRGFGLSGRSVVPLASGMACAVPAIMSARGIANGKERLITIMVTPLMTCSARLPVYVLLIALVVPEFTVLGVFSLQGLTLLGMYLLGVATALLAALVMKAMIKTKEKGFFMMEIPPYRSPRWKNIGLTIWEKVQVFVVEAGRVIVLVSVILWVLASSGPGDSLEKIEKKYSFMENTKELTAAKNSEKLAASYAGRFGKAIEPAIAPLGFDWKIGIALLTSFAAREVFVGTMATIYSVGNENNTATLKERMMADMHIETGEKIYSPATGLSLIIFYAFAMQCMSTLAVVFRETKKWKWPVMQFLYMTGLAYLASMLVYQMLK